MTNDRVRTVVGAVLLAAAVLVVYAPVAGHQFLEYDDGLYVTERPEVLAGWTSQTFWWGLSSLEIGNWHPITWWSHAATVEWFGLEAGAHHRVSVGIHALVAVVLLLTLESATGSFWRSLLVAALFALHPMRIESVAWVAERKDVLFGLFFVLAIAAHTGYVRHGGAVRYGLVLAAGAAALMSKAMAVTLPAVLLLLEVWPLARSVSWGRRIAGQLPLVVLCAVASLLAVEAQEAGGAVASIDRWPLSARLANAAVAYSEYVRATLWPSELAVFYPYPRDGYAAGVVAVSAGGVLIAAIGGLAALRCWPPVGVGVLWFLGTLVPVIGLVTVGAQARADRYSYLPSIGLALAVVWAVPTTWWRHAVARGVAVLVVAALAGGTRVGVAYWQSDETLFARALEVTRNNGVAHLNYGNAISDTDRFDEQRFHFERAIELGSNVALGHYNLGRVHARLGEFEPAVQSYRRALGLDPELVRAWNNLGTALSRLERPELAERAYVRALELAPNHPSSLFNLAMLRIGEGQVAEGIALGQRYLALRPADGGSRVRFAAAVAEAGEAEVARRALDDVPGLPAGGFGLLAGLEWARGAEARAVAAAERAVALAPAASALANDLAWMLATCRDESVRNAPRALVLARGAVAATNRQDAEVLDTLAAAEAAGGDFEAAERTIGEAIDRTRELGRLDLVPSFEERRALYHSQSPYLRALPRSGSS